MHGPLNLREHSTNVTPHPGAGPGQVQQRAVRLRPGHARSSASSRVQTTPQTIHDLLVAHQTDDPAAHAAGDRDLRRRRLGARPRRRRWACSVAVANPAHEAWRWTRVKRKTDKDDALEARQARGARPAAHRAHAQRRSSVSAAGWCTTAACWSTAARRSRTRSARSSASRACSLPPRGKAWTKLGIAQIAGEARPLAQCESIDDLWRGRLHVELQLLESLNQQIEQVDAKLDALGAADDRVQLLQTVPGVGPRLAESGAKKGLGVLCDGSRFNRDPSRWLTVSRS